MRRFIWTLAFLWPAFPGQGPFERIVFTGKGESHDFPAPHSLRYFASATHTLDAQPAPGDSINSLVERVGTLVGFSIWDVLYRILPKGEPARFNGVAQGRIAWKSILVQIGPDQYAEIYRLEATAPAPDLTSAKIVQSGRESILATEDFDGGNAGGCWEGYWWFDPTGAHRIDFSSLRPAIAAHLPSGARFSTACSAIDLSTREVKSWVQRGDAECHACGYLGEVTAHFRLQGSQVEAADIVFQAHPEH